MRHAAAGVLPRFDGDGPVKLLPQRAVALLRFIRGGKLQFVDMRQAARPVFINQGAGVRFVADGKILVGPVCLRVLSSKVSGRIAGSTDCDSILVRRY